MPLFPKCLRGQILTALALCLLGAGCLNPVRTEVVVLDSGPVVADADGVYKGIPYAAPPVGELRWRPPMPPAKWSAPRVFDEFGPVCPQPGEDGASEDCLTLNVWTPPEKTPALKPVMVFIHGGAFLSGAGSLPLYDGGELARKGVVAVTLNYRLGPLGFMAHPALSAESGRNASGNYGLMDQMAALNWVQNNIRAFGGDPDRVMVFGQSAGAESTALLLVSPEAEGLFARAAVQSPVLAGSIRPLREPTPDMVPAEEVGLAMQKALGADAAPDPLAAMRAVPWQKVLTAGDGLAEKYRMEVANMVFGPVIEGAVLPDDPMELYRRGRMHRVPILVGANSNEASLFLNKMFPESGRAEAYEAWVRDRFGPLADQALALAPATGDADREGPERLISARWFTSPALFIARQAARHGLSARYYRFTHPLPEGAAKVLAEEAGQEDMPADQVGVPHGAELFYVFGFTPFYLGFDGDDDAFAETVMDFWTGFAATGDPDAPGPRRWPEIGTPPGERALELGETVRHLDTTETDPLQNLMEQSWISR